MPINPQKISMVKIDLTNIKDISMVRKLSFENDFYCLQIKHMMYWEDQDSLGVMIIKYNDAPIGFVVYNWRTSNGYIFENFGGMETWGVPDTGKRAITSASANYPSVWVEMMMVDKKFQNLGIGKYVLNNLGYIFRKELGNHIKFIVFDIDNGKNNVNKERQIKFYKRNGCRFLCINRADNGMYVMNANNIR